MRTRLALALLVLAPDALAWGLHTHLYFADCALALLPFAEPRLREAALRFPRLVLAGACLPDLALAGRLIGTPAFGRSHRWSTLRRLAAVPRDEAELALAAGYASHLVTDVVAHNFFVPEHERRIARVPHATHALAEWAMDHHLRGQVREDAFSLLAGNEAAVTAFVARAFRCPPGLAARGIGTLARADALLRATPIPGLCRRIARGFERRLDEELEGYVRRAMATLGLIEGALVGAFTDWEGLDPEGHSGDQGADRRPGDHVAGIVQP